MKRILMIFVGTLIAVLTSNATVLFPFFVDIAPDYKEGNIETLIKAGVGSVTCSSTAQSYYPKTFEQAVSFLKDVLPGDVKVEETKIGNMRLITYTSLAEHNDDTIKTDGLLCKIYLLEQPDGTYHSGYSEVELKTAE